MRRAAIVLLAGCLVVAAILGRPAWHLISTATRDHDSLDPLPPGFSDDASRMNRTAVAEFVPIAKDKEAAEHQLAGLLERARSQGLRVSIAGARHSMGGHTIYPGGLVVDMLPFNHMDLDEESNLLHVGAGARWRDIIPFLDRHRRSVGVMQSDNTFSVGGSLSVNCHGWQFGRPPIASTVESFRLMRADGSIVRCSRTENEELFSVVLGGYGLFGIILDADLHVVPNERYRLEQFIVPIDDALATFESNVQRKPDAVMVYARMGIVPDDFLEEVILNHRRGRALIFLEFPGQASCAMSLTLTSVIAVGVLATLAAVFFGWRLASRVWSLPCPTLLAWSLESPLFDRISGTDSGPTYESGVSQGGIPRLRLFRRFDSRRAH